MMNYILVPGSNIEGREEFKYHRRLKDGRVICPAKDIMMLAGVTGIEIVTEYDLLALIRKEGSVSPAEESSSATGKSPEAESAEVESAEAEAESETPATDENETENNNEEEE